MGAGLAQLAAAAGARTLVHDPDAAALERGLERARRRLDEAAAGRLEPARELAALDGAEVVIEAAPESLELKRELLSRVAEAAGGDCGLATNTSSLSVAEIAAGVPGPERVVGMHFFNPAPVMRLVEVVAGEASGEAGLGGARAAGGGGGQGGDGGGGGGGGRRARGGRGDGQAGHRGGGRRRLHRQPLQPALHPRGPQAPARGD